MHVGHDPIFLLADSSTVSSWIAFGVALLATAFVLFRPRMKAKKDPLNRPPDIGSLSQQRAVERQMQHLLVELSEMARTVTAGLDTRAAKLDALIVEANEKIATLSALLQQSAASIAARSVARIADAPALPLPPIEQPPSAYDTDPRHVEVYILADQGQTPSQIAGQLNRPSGEIELILALRPRN